MNNLFLSFVLIALTAPMTAFAKGPACVDDQARPTSDPLALYFHATLGEYRYKTCSGAAISNGHSYYIEIDRQGAFDGARWTIWYDNPAILYVSIPVTKNGVQALCNKSIDLHSGDTRVGYGSHGYGWVHINGQHSSGTDAECETTFAGMKLSKKLAHELIEGAIFRLLDAYQRTQDPKKRGYAAKEARQLVADAEALYKRGF